MKEEISTITFCILKLKCLLLLYMNNQLDRYKKLPVFLRNTVEILYLFSSIECCHGKIWRLAWLFLLRWLEWLPRLSRDKSSTLLYHTLMTVLNPCIFFFETPVCFFNVQIQVFASRKFSSIISLHFSCSTWFYMNANYTYMLTFFCL